MSQIEEDFDDLSIESGSRHYRIKNDEDEIVFRTTNQRDAETYLDLVEENQRLQRLLEARGVAPHRIYLLSEEEEHRGEASSGKYLADEVVIVAKADDEEAVVVRHLESGKEEIVDLEELEPIQGGVYLQATEMADTTAHVVVRFPREFDPEDEEDPETVEVAAAADEEVAEQIVDDWLNLEDDQEPESKFTAVLAENTEDHLIFRAEADLQEEP
ncbi:MAG: hypothetical protein ABEL76_05265 [Bradymonadaceae bacterium]